MKSIYSIKSINCITKESNNQNKKQISLNENPHCLSENGLKSSPVPILISLKWEYHRLSKNLLSLERMNPRIGLNFH